MRIVQTLFGFFLIAFILLGNAGLRVFKHSCEEDGTFTSYILPSEDHCQEKEIEELPTCCQKEISEEACCSLKSEENDCCSDEVAIYTVDFDYFQDSDLEIPLIVLGEVSDFFNYPEIHVLNTSTKTFRLRPPPDPPCGREILIQHQVFRI